ncbi:MAG: DUF5010 domain-containing protein [Isosphaeraceae bacterium]
MTRQAKTVLVGSLLAASLGLNPASAEPPRGIPGPIGPHVHPPADAFRDTRTFGAKDKVVMTHYFYWYDVASKAHIIDGDGTDALTTHPATLHDFSYRSVAWHRRQLLDMIDAGIDVVLPVYWGAPSEQRPGSPHHWSFEGIPPLVKAAEALRSEGKRPPAIGLFYDTSTLQHNGWGVHVDLKTEFGKKWFYASIRDFFSLIPPSLWATIEGRPIVVLYAASFARAHDQGCIDFVKSEFAREFSGRVPYIIREASWRVEADNVYAWGGAVRPNFLGVAEIGPGYDHSAVPGRQPLIVPREDGRFYERAWQKALRKGSNIVILETWNEFHEGTSIAESRERGRKDIELTRRYVDLFKKGASPPPGPFTGAPEVRVLLGEVDREHGLKRLDAEDGHTRPAVVAGQACRINRPGGHYMYFQVDDDFKWARAMNATVEVEFLDDGSALSLEYDSHDPKATLHGAYTPCVRHSISEGSKTWKTATFRLEDARLDNRQNAGADFRLCVPGSNVAVRRVVVRPSARPR